MPKPVGSSSSSSTSSITAAENAALLISMPLMSDFPLRASLSDAERRMVAASTTSYTLSIFFTCLSRLPSMTMLMLSSMKPSIRTVRKGNGLHQHEQKQVRPRAYQKRKRKGHQESTGCVGDECKQSLSLLMHATKIISVAVSSTKVRTSVSTMVPDASKHSYSMKLESHSRRLSPSADSMVAVISLTPMKRLAANATKTMVFFNRKKNQVALVLNTLPPMSVSKMKCRKNATTIAKPWAIVPTCSPSFARLTTSRTSWDCVTMSFFRESHLPGFLQAA